MPSLPPRRLTRQQFLGLTALGPLLALTACTAQEENLAAQANQGDSKGYIAGDGSVTEYPADQRGQAVEFEGQLFDGKTVSAQDLRGKPALLNFWYAGCAPCRAEAPDLNALHQSFGSQVAFYGVNVRDEEATAQAFEKRFEVPYPSFKDLGGQVLLGLSRYVPAQAVPTTLLLDSQGRVAARILGRIDPSILRTLLQEEAA